MAACVGTHEVLAMLRHNHYPPHRATLTTEIIDGQGLTETQSAQQTTVMQQTHVQQVLHLKGSSLLIGPPNVGPRYVAHAVFVSGLYALIL